MVQDYKIYYNNSFVLITADRAQMNENFAKVFDTPSNIQEFLAKPDALFDGTTNEELLIVSDEPEEVLNLLIGQLDVVVAGGGLVFNENDELLLIYRRGHWDLAKGKIEPGEETITGAEREVAEETGVTIQGIKPKPIITYHAYYLRGKRCLKPTYWYIMQAKPGQTKLVPQTEEDIEDVRWVKKQDLINYKAGCYPLVWGLVEQFAQ